MLRLSVAKIRSPCLRHPSYFVKPSSKLSNKIPQSVANHSQVIITPLGNRAFVRLYSNKKNETPSTTNEKEELTELEEEEDFVFPEIDPEQELADSIEEKAAFDYIKEEIADSVPDRPIREDAKRLMEELELDEDDVKISNALFEDPEKFDEFYKPYETIQDGVPTFSTDPLDYDPLDQTPPEVADPELKDNLDELVEAIETQKLKEYTNDELKENAKNIAMKELDLEVEDAKEEASFLNQDDKQDHPGSDWEQKIIEALNKQWPGWEKDWDGNFNPEVEQALYDILDILGGDQQGSKYDNSEKVAREYTRLSAMVDTIDSKFDEWKQQRKQFQQFVLRHRQATHFGMPTARIRFGRASGLRTSQLNPDLAVSLKPEDSPAIVSAPPPFPGGGCKHIAMNRPAQYNPLNLETLEHLSDLMKKWNENSVVYSITLKGNGPAFVGGFDLKEMANSDSHVKRQYTYHFYSLMRTLSAMRKFYVPIANGIAAGPGVPIFVWGTAPYVTENAVLTCTDAAAGLYPLGSFEALNRLFPKWFTKFLLMTGYPITAGHWSMIKGKHIPQSRIGDLERRLSEVLSSKPARFKQALNEVDEPTFLNPDRIDDGGNWLSTKYELIGKAFNHTSVPKILEYLDEQNDPFATDLANRMRMRSPLALLLIQLRFNIEAKREQFHQRRMAEIRAEVEEAKRAAEQVTPENVRNFLATLPQDVFGRGIVSLYDTAVKATQQMKPMLNTIVPGRELTPEGVEKLKEGIDTRVKGIAFSVQDFVKAVWDKHSQPFLLSPDGATVYPWDPEYPKILYCMKPPEEREKLIKLWHENQAEIVEKLRNPTNRDPNEALFDEESEAVPGVQGIVLPEGGAFNWFAEEAVRQHNEIIMQSVPENFWDHMCQKVYYHKPGEPFDPKKLAEQGGHMLGSEFPDVDVDGANEKDKEISTEEKIRAERDRQKKELIKIRQMEARAFYRTTQSPEFPAAVNSLLQKTPTPNWKSFEQYDFKTVLSYFMPGPDTAELDAAIASLDEEPLPDIVEWIRAKKYRPYWNHAVTMEMDAEEAL